MTRFYSPQYQPLTDAARNGERGDAAPYGTSLGTLDVAFILGELVDVLGLQPIAVVTPWATQDGDVAWESGGRQPDTNTALWRLTDQDLERAKAVTYGAPVPFVAILSDRLLPIAEVDRLWHDTTYRAYETQAVYRQDDQSAVPKILFLYWGERRDMTDIDRPSPLGPRAALVGGVLVFGLQVPADSTTTREYPDRNFEDALRSARQLDAIPAVPITAMPGPAPAPAPSPPRPGQPITRPAAAPAPATDWQKWKPWLFGAAAVVGAFVVVREVRKQTT